MLFVAVSLATVWYKMAVSVHRYRGTVSSADSFDIRLMKEGRMKGQAFITLGTDQQALKALRDTNAFAFKGKPMAVVRHLPLTPDRVVYSIRGGTAQLVERWTQEPGA